MRTANEKLMLLYTYATTIHSTVKVPNWTFCPFGLSSWCSGKLLCVNNLKTPEPLTRILKALIYIGDKKGSNSFSHENWLVKCLLDTNHQTREEKLRPFVPIIITPKADNSGEKVASKSCYMEKQHTTNFNSDVLNQTYRKGTRHYDQKRV